MDAPRIGQLIKKLTTQKNSKHQEIINIINFINNNNNNNNNKVFISDNRIHSIKVHRFLHINVKRKIHNTIAYTYIHLYTEHNNKKTWETTAKSNHPLSPAYEEAYSSASLILIYL